MRYLALLFILLSLGCFTGTRQYADEFPMFDPPVCISEMDGMVYETSGLIYWDDMLWTLNDSGDDPKLYQVDTQTGDVLRTVWIKGADNVDWEELAQDSSYLYIGDIGNNNGDRQDLRIYKVSKSALILSSVDSILAEGMIAYSYPEQTNFQPNNHHNFDCEGFISMGDSLYLFTKNRGDGQTYQYALPKEAGTYDAAYQGRFDVKGTITAADYQASTQQLVLTGYNWDQNPWPFIWVFSDVQGHQFLQGTARRFNLEPHTQIEAICFSSHTHLYLSCEKNNTPEARLYCFSIDEL
ncbi:MAG: hypothetical protein AAF587_27550 [Bacteroidota bacterium]